MQRSFKNRLEALERARWARLTPLERALELVEQDVPPAQWPDAELNAFCEDSYRDWPELRTMSDEELERYAQVI